MKIHRTEGVLRELIQGALYTVDKELLRDELREYANMLVEIESRFEQYNETDHQQEKRTVVV